MKFELNEYHYNVPVEDLIADLKKVAQELRRETLIRDEYNKRGKYSSTTLARRFGGWLNALEKAGLKKTRHYLTDDEILDELRRIAKLLKKEFVTREDLRRYSDITNDTVAARHFGSFTVALRKAGLKVSPQGRKYSNEDYFENLLNIWTHYGRQPSTGEINKAPSLIRRRSYERRFGTWRKALEAFVAKMNQDDSLREHVTQDREALLQEAPQILQERQGGVVEDKRDISLGLRYKVLSRDNFKCVKCGMSPATDHKCKLHVDHKIPFSKGGKTILENLQTLCENCNLGKGDRHLG